MECCHACKGTIIKFVTCHISDSLTMPDRTEQVCIVCSSAGGPEDNRASVLGTSGRWFKENHVVKNHAGNP